ncbi:hypothetical protein [Staphylococcus hominis]|uniref:hypothetical protein n=1 Tax=Staphylococcus hominis TaxID=1290 RepID=UPI00066E3526|nr:hypothetical protein [Staphylococcus hominis]
MILSILGYVLGIGFIVFGIAALVNWGSEFYKVVSKSKEKGNYKKSYYFDGLAIICAVALIIMANIF